MYYKTNNISIYYEHYGNKNSKKKIVILPGWGNTRESFKYIIDYFKDNYQIYIIDYPGFGNSKFPKDSLTIYDYTEVIIDFLKDLKINNPIIIAHSFGGRIAILLNGYYKIKIDKMIFISTAGIKQKRNIKKTFRLYLYKFLKNLKVFLSKRKRSLYLKKLLLVFGSKDYNDLPNSMKETFKNIVNTDLLMYLKDIESEVLLIWGENDHDTPIKDAFTMNKKIKDSALITISDCGHFCYLEQISLINNIIYEFIKEEIFL